MEDPLYLAVPLFMALIVLEAIATRRRGGYSAKDTLTSLSTGLTNLAMAAVTKGATLALFVTAHRFAVFELPVTPWILVLAVVCEDFTAYWHHRAHHQIRFLWATHVVHHSSRRLNLSMALRHSFMEPITEPLFYVPMALLGFDPLVMLSAQAFTLIYGFFPHTEVVRKLGPLEAFLVTPSHHRVHHGRNPLYLDRNFGVVFIVWDRLFRTFQAESERPDYGIVHNLETHNPLTVLFHEWIDIARDLWRAESWRERWRYVFGPPGWSPRGDSLTVAELRARSQAASTS